VRVGSLFSGIGGLDLGLERAGMEVVWQVEVDDWCRRVLERHWPDVARFRDVRDCHGALAHANGGRQQECQKLDSHASPHSTDGDSCGEHADGCRGYLPPVDLICGGFPCQPVSHAGQRAGESDSRWLWPEFHRIVCEAQPRWVLVENVPGLRSIDDGRLFGGILRDLAEAGYDAVWFDLSAADVGAPHLRERVFIVAHAQQRGRDGLHERKQAGYLATNTGGCSPDQPQRTTTTDYSGRLSGEGSKGGHDVAHAEGVTGEVRQAQTKRPRRPTGGGVADADAVRRGRGQDDEGATPPERDGASGSGWWTVEPDVGRVAARVPARVDRLRGLGNAVVPQVAEVIGRWIMETA